MSTVSLAPHQVERLKQAHALLEEILSTIGANGAPRVPEPKWKGEWRRMWRLLKAIELAGGDVSFDEWRRLGSSHGYDPRGLGGFFTGYSTMESNGDRRRLTDHGRRWIQQWEPEFGPYEAP